jgi:hypothetical protein
MAELNEKNKSYQNKALGTEKLDISDENLRQYHIAIENIFDNLKSHKSSRDFKWLFLLLLSIVLIATAIHIARFGIGFNLIPLILLLAYWVYYRYTLKKAIEKQALANQKINDSSPEENDNKGILINRLRYILNGIDVLNTRIILIRNQYVLLFPVFAMVVIDIIRGPLGWGAFTVTAVVSVILGGLFWIYYFRNDLIDLENATDELEIIEEKLGNKHD